MSKAGGCQPSQEFKISSSTDRAGNRRKTLGHNQKKVIDNSQKPSYKRASERPAAAVARRNARERRRVHTVNQAFNRLRTYVPTLKQKTKRVSKLKILKAAIDYVYDLQDILADCEPPEIVVKEKAKTYHGQQQRISNTAGQKLSKNISQGHFDYSGSLVENQVSKNHTINNHRAAVSSVEDDRAPRHQNLAYQYQLPVPLVNATHSHGRTMIAVPTVPSASTGPGGSALFYGSGHTDFVPCPYCGHSTPASAYGGAAGPCDRCSAFATYTYVGNAPSSIVL